MNAVRDIEISTRFMQLQRRVRPKYAQGSWFYSRQYSPHAANIVKQFLAKSGWCKLNIYHSRQISILLTSSHFHDSSSTLKGKRFGDISDIQRSFWRDFLNFTSKRRLPVIFPGHASSRSQGSIIDER
ncbi:hypothetical protein TNCV_912871 [Trichonephila clavipes]|nr:hypothetical protein TNCV_912871 [Trichonephila clavipes]